MTDVKPGTSPVDRIQEFARALRPLLPQYLEVITDLTGGRGQLIAGLSDHTTTHGLICDIKPHQMVKVNRPAYQSLEISRITGDICQVYPLLKEVDWRGDCFVISPPLCAKWDKTGLCALEDSHVDAVKGLWRGQKGEAVDSTLATWMIALDRCSERGEGVLVTTDVKNVISSPLWSHVWLHLLLTANPLQPDKDTGEWGKGAVSVAFWAASHTSGPQMEATDITSLTDLQGRVGGISDLRSTLRRGVARHYANSATQDSAKDWEGVRTEWQQRHREGGRTDYNLFLEDVRLKVQLNRYQELLNRKDPRDVRELFTLIDKTPTELVIQADSRGRLLKALNCGLWRIQPDLPGIVEEAIDGYNSQRAPLYALPPTQRLAYIDEVQSIKCTRSWLRFEAGKEYPVSTSSVTIERMKAKPNLQGDLEDILCNAVEMLISIKDPIGHETLFIDSRHMKKGVTITPLTGGGGTIKPDYGLQDLLDHFEVPEVPDVSVTSEEGFGGYRHAMNKIQEFVNQHIDPAFGFKAFQREDYSRAACHNGVVLAHSCGLGKSLAAIAFSAVKAGINWPASHAAKGLVPLKPILIVAPESIHNQLSGEWRSKFGIIPIPLDSQETYLRMTDSGRKHLKPAFYLSSYTQMGLNKIKKLTVPDACIREFPEVAKLMYEYGVTLDEVKAFQLDRPLSPGANLLMEKAIALCNYRYHHYKEGVGETRNGVKCIFSPSLADLSGHEFECVVIDEGVRIKAEDSIIGKAIRELDPPYRLVLTATPVKNRLRDLFYLMWWAAGGKPDPHPRFPYSEDEQDKFSADFQVCERNLTKEAKRRSENQRHNPYGSKTLPKPKKTKSRGTPGIEVCSIHRLWKITAPLVLRRRKQDIGEEIVAKKKNIIRVPMGAKQYEVYRYHLLGVYLDKDGKQCLGPKLQALRSVAAAPNSELLRQLPESQEGVGNGIWRSDKDYTPKLAACLSILEQRMRAGEQSIVFSALHEPLDTLSKRLNEAGVPHDVLDGRTSAAARGRAAAKFQKGLAGGGKPVMLAGAKSMGEGLSFHLANNVIVLSFDWAWDTYEQSINRCHRLNSVKDVNVWPIICTGTIDRKLEAMLDEKGDASELVIDGRLIGEDSQEVNLRELLTIAEEEFRGAQSYPEHKLEQEWPELRKRLADAWSACRSGNVVEPVTTKIWQPDNSLPRLLERIRKMKELRAA